ncbi:hypothetical protein PRUPE_3G091600 [Prunus persica]|uniref:Uncharacterized protein n=1 Tax=Prunus persica TaxID=3760 RepID=A0A251Q0T5_PRUPE|nr:UPF0481 protein At3g47200 [Prunus persica]ONI16315.1 hypothetical protein PRUPE_3G091600 [Prunus persica]
MGKGSLFTSSWFLLQKITCRVSRARGFHGVCDGSSSNGRKASLSLIEELEMGNNVPKERDICIYKVPNAMRQMKRKAYEPNIVSIGPYHHGVASLQEMEKVKRIYFRRLFKPNTDDDSMLSVKETADPEMMQLLDDAKKAMQELEEKARRCYSEESELSSEEFVKMMLIDGCFIIGFLRDASEQGFEHTPSTVERWMLPIIRQDLIKLENQLPLFVLRRLYDKLIITKTSSSASDHQKPKSSDLEALSIRFFKPLLQGSVDPDKPLQHFAPKHEGQGKHFLDLFHHNICPEHNEKEVDTLPRKDMKHNLKPQEKQTFWHKDLKPQGKQTQLILSIRELKEAGVKFKRNKKPCRPLDISFSRGTFDIRRKVLTIPAIHINDHRATLFRNMLAFEKCHRYCQHQDVTTYLFFLDGLINSAKDVGLLHYHGILFHSLGSNRRVAKLVNNLCKEVVSDMSQSYLYEVVRDVDAYYNSRYAKVRAFLVHHHFSSWLVGISTLGACLALYLAVVQTVCTVATAKEQLGSDFSLGSFLIDSLLPKHVSGGTDSKPS